MNDAFAHPAKFSRALIRRIYQHLLEHNYVDTDDVVLDPFAGVALGALHAMHYGLHWVGVELEERFVNLGQQNLDLWDSRYAVHMPTWGTAILLQGDSRRLCEVMQKASCVMSSPPYADGCAHTGGDDSNPEYIKGGKYHGVGIVGCVSSPPYAGLGTKTGKVDESAWSDGRPRPIGISQRESAGYGTHPAQLGSLPEGNHVTIVSSPPYHHTLGKGGETKGFHSYDENEAYNRCKRDYVEPKHPAQLGNLPEGSHVAVVSSPPYAASATAKNSPGVDLRKQYETYRSQGGGASFEAFCDTQQLHSQGYGDSEGQLATMPVKATASSPPYEGGIPHGGRGTNLKIHKQLEEKYHRRYTERPFPPNTYGKNSDQLGIEQGETFWSAARTIMEQCYQILKPDGVAVWVVKAFVRNKQRVDFPNQWRQLGESCGFETLEWIRAWLVEDRGAQFALNGDLVERKVERKSFFRRLAEKKGSPRIDYEVVLIQRKPTND